MPNSAKTIFTRPTFGPSPAGAAGRHGRFLLTLVCAALGTACPEPPPPPQVSLPVDRILTSETVVAAPDRHWMTDKKHADRWLFRGVGAVHVFLRETPGHLSLVFEPDQRTAELPFEVSWDQERLLAEPVVFGPDRSRIEIPGDRLGPGIHVLSLRRIYGRDQLPINHDNVFRTLGWELDGEVHVLAPDRLERFRDLSDFLSFGLGGASRQKRSGFLFLGPRSEQVEIETDSKAVLRVHAENLSAKPAVLAVKVGESRSDVRLDPRSGHDFRIPLAAGPTALSFTAEGDPEGLFLWGAPRVVREQVDRDRTPVVLISLDTTRRDALGLYTGRSGLTPHLDALAEEADVFERAYSSAPWTLPSHMSMLTGLYPSRHGSGVRTMHLFDTLPTLSRLLRDSGYLTAGFAGGDLCSYRFGVGAGFDLYRDPDHFETRGSVLTGYVEELLESRHGEALFLFVNYFDAHGPYEAPEEFRRRRGVGELAGRVAGQPLWGDLAQGDKKAWRQVARSDAEPTPEGLEYLRASYEAEVASVDSQVGRLLAALRQHDLYDRALIVVVGDHGELLGENGNFGHSGRLDPELTEVPLIVKRPHQRGGRRIATLVSGVDVFPTVLRAAGVEAPPGDGLPLDPDLLAASRRGQVFLEEHEARVHPLNPNLKLDRHVYGVQKPGFRQIVWAGGQECQRRDAAGWHETSCTMDREELLGHVERILGDVEHPDLADAGVLDEEATESLRALGYL